jgi:hypothetical protein
MILYRYLIVVTLLVFISCQTKQDKSIEQTGKKENIQARPDAATRAEQVPGLTAAAQADSSWGSYIAVLKDGIDQVNATIGDSNVFVATKGQQFLYENNSHSAWIADGRCAYIPPEQVKRADVPYFKFSFSRWNFIKNENYELSMVARQINIDLNSLIKKIQHKDNQAMLRFFNMRKYVNGAAAAEYSFDLWALINLWTDQELSALLQSLREKEKNEFCHLLMNITPFEQPEEYFKLYYPNTLAQINQSD